jgi:hypothetical protein
VFKFHCNINIILPSTFRSLKFSSLQVFILLFLVVVVDKGKAVPLPTKAPRYEDILGEWRHNHVFFDLGARWKWMVSFTPRPLYPRERAPGTHWIGGWVDLRAGLDTVWKRKIPSPRRESNTDHPIVQWHHMLHEKRSQHGQVPSVGVCVCVCDQVCKNRKQMFFICLNNSGGCFPVTELRERKFHYCKMISLIILVPHYWWWKHCHGNYMIEWLWNTSEVTFSMFWTATLNTLIG